MKRIWIGIALWGMMGATAYAGQPPLTSGDRLAWEQETDGTVAASSLVYRVIDNGVKGDPLPNVICQTTGTLTLMACTAPFPPLKPGTHTITLTAAIAGDAGSESPESNTLSFKVTISAPKNLRKQ